MLQLINFKRNLRKFPTNNKYSSKNEMAIIISQSKPQLNYFCNINLGLRHRSQARSYVTAYQQTHLFFLSTRGFSLDLQSCLWSTLSSSCHSNSCNIHPTSFLKLFITSISYRIACLYLLYHLSSTAICHNTSNARKRTCPEMAGRLTNAAVSSALFLSFTHPFWHTTLFYASGP